MHAGVETGNVISKLNHIHFIVSRKNFNGIQLGELKKEKSKVVLDFVRNSIGTFLLRVCCPSVRLAYVSHIVFRRGFNVFVQKWTPTQVCITYFLHKYIHNSHI